MTSTSSVGPTREPERSKEPQSESHKKIVEKYLQYLQIDGQRNALKKYEEIIETVISKIASDISHDGGKLIDIQIDPATGSVKVQIQEEGDTKWKKTQELQDLFGKISKSISDGDPEKTLQALLQIAKAQLDPKETAHPSYQKAFNAALKNTFQGQDGKNASMTEDYTLRLYMIQMGQKATKKWGASLPGMQQTLVQKLENQISSTEDNATPFKAAAEPLAAEVSNMNEADLKKFISTDNEERHKKLLLQMIMDAMISPQVKAALQKDNHKLEEESSEKAKPKAEEEARIQFRKNQIVSRLSTQIFDKEFHFIRDAINELKLTETIDKNRLFDIENQLNEASSAHDVDGIIKVMNALGNVMDFSSRTQGAVDQHKLNALEVLKRGLSDLKNLGLKNTDDLKAAIQVLETSINGAVSTRAIVDEMNAILAKKDPSSEDYKKLMEDYLKLFDSPGNVSGEVSALKKAIEEAKIKTPDGRQIPLLERMAACYIALSPMPSKLTPESVQIWLITVIPNLIKHPDAKAVRDAFNKVATGAKPPDIGFDPYSGQSLFLPQIEPMSGKVTGYVINHDFAKEKGVKITDVEKVQEISQKTSSDISKKIADWNETKSSNVAALKEIQDIANSTTQMSKLMDLFSKGINDGKSITDLFIDVILGDYTLFLEMGLRLLANQLNLRTAASKGFQDASSKITDWANIKKGDPSDNSIGFANWYKEYMAKHPSGSKEPFDIKEVQKKAQEEWNKLKEIKAGASESSAKLDDFIKQKTEELKNPNITPEEKKEIESEIAKAQKEKAELSKITDNLTKLQNDLKSIIDLPAQSSPEAIAKAINDKDINKTESTVINGQKDEDPKKSIMGLAEFLGELQATAKEYGGQGEELQMKLGRSFNNMQMIYTTITSCIQILNRMASAPINATKGQ